MTTLGFTICPGTWLFFFFKSPASQLCFWSCQLQPIRSVLTPTYHISQLIWELKRKIPLLKFIGPLIVQKELCNKARDLKTSVVINVSVSLIEEECLFWLHCFAPNVSEKPGALVPLPGLARYISAPVE